MTTREEAIRLAREADILFQSHIGITNKENISTQGSQPIKRIERLIQLVENNTLKKAAKVCSNLKLKSDKPVHDEDDCEAAILALVKE